MSSRPRSHGPFAALALALVLVFLPRLSFAQG